MIGRLISYLRGIARRRTIGIEADEELQFHLEQETAANVASGMTPAEARRTALRDLGGFTQTRESIRDVRTTVFDSLWRDARYGSRALRASPRFTIVALVTIVLMVGGITTIFTLVNAVLLRPLPYPASERLTLVQSTGRDGRSTSVTLADAIEFQKQSQSFELWGLFRPGYVSSILDARNEPVSVQDMRVSPGIFPMLEIGIVLGRPLQAGDTESSSPDVAVIGHEIWQAQFGGAADVLSKTLQVRGKAHAIVGVAAPGADVPANFLGRTYPIVWRAARPATDGDNGFRTLARLREGVSNERGSAELMAIAARLAADKPATHKDRAARSTLLLDDIVGDFKQVLWIFFGAVSCVLMIGLANLLSLQIVRNSAREREISLRAALGASRWRLVRQLLVESVLLSLVGGAMGLAVAWQATHLILQSLPPRFPRADEIGIDFTVALFACAIALVVGVIFGSIPAWRTSRVQLSARLNEGGRSATQSGRRMHVQRVLILFETAVALVLLIGAALLVNSFERLLSRDAGMQEENLWSIRATLPSSYRDNGVQRAFWATALDNVRKLPDVEAAALVVNSSGPLTSGDIQMGGVFPEGVSKPRGEGLSLSWRRVSADYFSTVGTPVLKGRPILASDIDGAEGVVVLNDLAAAALWPGEEPIGKRLQGLDGLLTVVGVIANHRNTRLDREAGPQMFTSYLQRRSVAGTSVIMVRTRPGATGISLAATSVLTNLEKDVTVRASTMAGVRWTLLAAERFRTTVLLVFAIGAVFLALVGIFGLVAYTVSQRQREIAVRVALGATSRDVMSLVMQQVVMPAFAGLVVGVLVAAGASRLLSTFLVDIQPTDPPTFAIAFALLGLAAFVAGLVPARQVLAIHPTEALRHE